MKASFSRSLTSLLAVITFLACTAQLHAAPVDLLRDAYATLAKADHDYKGHRVDAMKEIEEAAKLLGVTLKGDDKEKEKEKEKEKQGVSDTEMRAAFNLLQQAKPGLSGKPLKRVEQAEKEILTGLKIK